MEPTIINAVKIDYNEIDFDIFISQIFNKEFKHSHFKGQSIIAIVDWPYNKPGFVQANPFY